MNLRFIHENLFPLVTAAALIAAVVCWFGTSLPQLPVPPPSPAESWELPLPPERNVQKSVTSITVRDLWNTVVPVAKKEPEWHVVGIATAGAERFILMSYEGKPVATLKVGDTLPDETKIVQIEKDRFFVMTPNKKKLAFGLYKNDQAK